MGLQLDFGFAPRPKLSLPEVMFLIEKHRILAQVPCRETLINWCEDGTLDAVRTPLGWQVYQDSFIAFVARLDQGDATVFASLAA